MNTRWLVNKIEEMAQDIKDLKEIMKAVPDTGKETKYPINKGK